MSLASLAGARIPHSAGGAVDPYWDDVVSLLPFNEAAQTDGALNADSKLYDTDDLKGNAWTLISYNKIEVSACFGSLGLGAWGVSQSISTRGVLYSNATPSFAATGDFTMEFTVSPDNARGNWGASGDIILISGLANGHPNGPVDASEWMFTWSAGGGGALGFTIKASDGLLRTALVTPIVFSLTPHEIVVQRISGVLSVLLDGVTVAVQSVLQAPDNTTLFDQVTFSSNGTGADTGTNNLGSGAYSRWRYTVGIGRYPSGSYTPDGLPFPTRGI